MGGGQRTQFRVHEHRHPAEVVELLLVPLRVVGVTSVEPFPPKHFDNSRRSKRVLKFAKPLKLAETCHGALPSDLHAGLTREGCEFRKLQRVEPVSVHTFQGLLSIAMACTEGLIALLPTPDIQLGAMQEAGG